VLQKVCEQQTSDYRKGYLRFWQCYNCMQWMKVALNFPLQKLSHLSTADWPESVGKSCGKLVVSIVTFSGKKPHQIISYTLSGTQQMQYTQNNLLTAGCELPAWVHRIECIVFAIPQAGWRMWFNVNFVSSSYYLLVLVSILKLEGNYTSCCTVPMSWNAQLRHYISYSATAMV